MLCFPESHQWSEVSSLSKVILVFGKPEVAGCQIWVAGGLSHLGDLMLCQKNSAQDLTREQVCHRDEAANHQLPIAEAF